MSGPQHAPRDPEVRADLEEVVRQDRQLSPHPHEQRSDRVDQQPHQADQTHRLWLSALRELPDQSLALRGQAELASPRLDCGGMNVTPPESDDPGYFGTTLVRRKRMQSSCFEERSLERATRI